MIRRLRSFWNNEDGVGTVDGLIWTVAGLMIASIAIDGSYVWRTQTQLQTAADASALAAAAYIPSGQAGATDISIKVAAQNVPTSTGSVLLDANDIVFGRYDTTSGFAPVTDFTKANAAHVTIRREKASGTQLRSMLMGLVGKEDWDLGAQAIAVYQSSAVLTELCNHGALVSLDQVQMGGADDITNNFCVHGDKAAVVGAGGMFDNSIAVSSTDVANIQVGSFGPNTVSLDDITYKRQASDASLVAALALAQDLQQSVADTSATHMSVVGWNERTPFDIFSSDLSAVPVHASTGTWVVDGTTLATNAVYYHKGDVLIPAGTTFDRVALIVDGSVRHVAAADDPDQQNDAKLNGVPVVQTYAWVEYRNSVVIADALALTGPTTAGTTTPCGDTEYDSYFISTADVTIGSDGATTSLDSVYVAAGSTVYTDGGIEGDGVYMESRGVQRHIGGTLLSGCDTGLTPPFSSVFTEEQKVAAARLVY